MRNFLFTACGLTYRYFALNTNANKFLVFCFPFHLAYFALFELNDSGAYLRVTQGRLIIDKMPFEHSNFTNYRIVNAMKYI